VKGAVECFQRDLSSDVSDAILEIRKQVEEALTLSRERTIKASQTADGDLKNELVWQAYSQVELAIGLAKLSYPDQIKDEAKGRLQRPARLKDKVIQEGSTDVSSYKLDSCKDLLEQSSSMFRQEGGAEEGLKKAREARDILKFLVLGENLRKTTNRREKKPLKRK
jgi:hypothetical protein